MGWNSADVYYQPETFGLEKVFELELDNEAWQFNILAVWRDADGILWYAVDSGCSCPSPFENYTSKEMLDRFQFEEVASIIKSHVASSDRYYGGLSKAEASEAIRSLRDLTG